MQIGEYKDGYPFAAVIYPFNRPDAIAIMDEPDERMIEYIGARGITQAYVCAPPSSDYSFLARLTQLEHILIDLRSCERIAQKLPLEHDLSPVYRLLNLRSIEVRDNLPEKARLKSPISVDRFPKLERVAGESFYYRNIDKALTLKSLSLSHYETKSASLAELSPLREMDTLQLSFSPLTTLEGIGELPKLRCLYLTYCKRLHDIAPLSGVKDTLAAMRLQHCGKIDDFSVLAELKALELLEITRGRPVESIRFVEHMPRLQTLILGARVSDDDLTPCLRLNYAACLKFHKTYNLTKDQLPHGAFSRGNQGVDEWRRLE